MNTNNLDLTFNISNISLLSPYISQNEDLLDYFNQGIFQNEDKFDIFLSDRTTTAIAAKLSTPLKKRMSDLSKGICAVLECGIKDSLLPTEEIHLVTAFAEIETTNKIINSIINDKSLLVSPTLFHNSVHNTPLGYFTVTNKIHNYCVTISDGLDTNKSFIDFLRMRLRLKNTFIITSGEESSGFYGLDNTHKYEILPIFTAYRINANESGIKLLAEGTTLNQINLNDYDYVFADFNTFKEIKNKSDKIYTDYPLTRDNPAAVAIRLALPTLLNLTGRTLIIDKNQSDYAFFEVTK